MSELSVCSIVHNAEVVMEILLKIGEKNERKEKQKQLNSIKESEFLSTLDVGPQKCTEYISFSH